MLNSKIRNHTLVCFLLYTIFAIISLVINDFTKLHIIIVAMIAPWLIYVVFKIIKLKLMVSIIYINWIFCAISTIYGSTLGGYSFSWFDNLLHFSSGIFFSVLSFIIYAILTERTKAKNIKEIILQLLFINGTNMLVAFIWELYEYLLLIVLKIDAINHYSEGAHDIMGDLIVCFIGGIIISLFVVKHYNNGNCFIVKFTNDFLIINGKKIGDKC